MDRDVEYLTSLVHELRALPRETEWIEFKENTHMAEEIGEYLSALANSAAMTGKAYAYIIWGISDRDHTVVGTTFKPRSTKVGNEELENWLLRLLAPRIYFNFFEFIIDDRAIVVLEVERAFRHPVQFKGQEYIRVGSYKKKLKEFPEKERALWRIFDQTPFEIRIAVERVDDDTVLELLDYPAYFELFGRPLPRNLLGILDALQRDGLIHRCDAGGWDVPKPCDDAVCKEVLRLSETFSESRTSHPVQRTQQDRDTQGTGRDQRLRLRV